MKKLYNFFYRALRFVGAVFAYRQVLYFFQYLTRGFSDRQAWSLDITVAKFIIPRLKRLKEIGLGYPMTFNSMIGWHGAIDKMIWSFEYALKDYGGHDYDFENMEDWKLKQKMRMKRYNEGMKLFAKYYKDLWL